MSGVNDIRSTFLDYFRKEGHEIVASSPLVPRNDPTLMFTNAGMVQFKNVFTGLEKRPYSRASTAQKSVRAGGKHNDLDNVGYTARHLTFFEMLGNFSFGDYFKERAIELAWNLITKDFGLPKDKLLVTVYHTDDEAAGYWKKIAGFSDDRIIRIPTSDNFWAMGDTGPCGPCSEIFIDRGEHIWGGPPGSPEEDGDRFLEFWNLVFMQYEQVTKDERIDLPRPSIDTGMGLERMASILQGVESVFETDLFKHLIDAASSALGQGPNQENVASYRVIADHLRSCSFLVADGVLPSNEGRGYVLRRIMRRGMRHAQLLGAKEPLMWQLVPALVREMGQAYPELVRGEALITETLKLEETRFRKTLVRGLGLLSEATEQLHAGDMLDGETAFKLYDTYGFPLDLTQDALRQRSISVDIAGFTDAMERQKAEARAHWAGSGEAATETVWFPVREKAGATDFLGYETEEAEGLIQALVKDGKTVDSASQGDAVAVVVNQTPFYGESGGQMGDTGVISGDGFSVEVSDTQKKADGLFVHMGKVTNGTVKTGAAVELKVDHARRSKLRANHSATHLIHEALREVLGTHVAQKGSLVAPERLRLDVSHNKPISAEELEDVERMANEIVVQNSPVTTRLMSVDDAIAEGAMALFGEKYGDEVRVVSMGTGLHGAKANRPYSVELCGGTHVRSTGDIGLVRILSDSAVAAGVRRIEALTGEAARRHLDEQDKRLKAAAATLKISPADVPARVETLLEERKKLEKDLAEARKKLALGGGTAVADAPAANETVAGVGFLGKAVSGVAPKDLKPLADAGKKTLGSGVVVFVGAGEDNKASVVVGVTEDLTGRFSAIDLVRVASAALGGQGGGGRPDMAQAGGPDASKADDAIAAVRAALEAA
ncbi:alanine--tRNA ligase [Mesorhizobium sp. M1C.F.Ca.ET.193.01.1.1]|uniref:alanine--tRNA ligase n=2 Tax=Mesorhizobium TaxID=68287 RepID=UPI000FD1CBDF|nr:MULTISPECIES: alanine--tRNA ligase [unclassified Mesorhizobium]TGT00510.1 alanine--tRNA ligase [bacterium M00.F.Ca.ET.177.01.1.1]TGQ53924.1 alanine--tRNA ligase [Mesorhizobium sp. M1C.F.Ca.ET.210.01.1.1]TGQ71946.1 alanine--tRNA ligase [Mesorhizobium sp. M1C.F.Ca.ET.212.01.1.1]TGR08671.1 alanine--tRNA ligase [Mesorhizobium sp. M1C.F.Ca.ET.204.01.1.1]TGR29407.1 alanine--tRNA ligase [Mesorhizobium sp. M1C.F.Ca.ET.196.01.1.1]